MVIWLGFCVAGAVIEFVESVGELFLPLSPSEGVVDAAALGQQVRQVSPVRLLPVWLAWMAGPFCGALVAAHLAESAPVTHGLFVGGIVLVLVATLLVSVSYPLWFAVLGAGTILPSAVMGGWLFGPVADEGVSHE